MIPVILFSVCLTILHLFCLNVVFKMLDSGAASFRNPMMRTLLLLCDVINLFNCNIEVQRRFQNFSYMQLQCTLTVTFDGCYFVLLNIETNLSNKKLFQNVYLRVKKKSNNFILIKTVNYLIFEYLSLRVSFHMVYLGLFFWVNTYHLT